MKRNTKCLLLQRSLQEVPFEIQYGGQRYSSFDREGEATTIEQPFTNQHISNENESVLVSSLSTEKTGSFKANMVKKHSLIIELSYSSVHGGEEEKTCGFYKPRSMFSHHFCVKFRLFIVENKQSKKLVVIQDLTSLSRSISAALFPLFFKPLFSSSCFSSSFLS